MLGGETIADVLNTLSLVIMSGAVLFLLVCFFSRKG